MTTWTFAWASYGSNGALRGRPPDRCAHVAESQVRQAMAHAESIVDNIAFQVNEAYRNAVTSWVGIEDARPAVDQASENYRLVQLRLREGAAIPSEIADAQASLTRSEQNFLNARYNYLIAMDRLQYAWEFARPRGTTLPDIIRSENADASGLKAMSTIQSPQAPPGQAATAVAHSASIPSARRRRWLHPGRRARARFGHRADRYRGAGALIWVDFRRTHSITDDAFVEAHIVNVASQLVSGRIIRLLADENDRVGQGQVIAELDPIPYRDKVNISLAQRDSAQAELARQALRPGPRPQGGPDPDRDFPANAPRQRLTGQGRGVVEVHP